MGLIRNISYKELIRCLFLFHSIIYISIRNISYKELIPGNYRPIWFDQKIRNISYKELIRYLDYLATPTCFPQLEIYPIRNWYSVLTFSRSRRLVIRNISYKELIPCNNVFQAWNRYLIRNISYKELILIHSWYCRIFR